MRRCSVLASVFLCVMLLTSGGAAPEYLRPLEGKTFCIEAGSGGEADESGAQGKSFSAEVLRTERTANLYVALFLREMLEIAGARVVYVGGGAAGQNPDISERMRTALSAGASCYISINHSVAKDPALNFAAVYCYPQYKEPETTLGMRISKEVAAELGIQDIGVRVFGFQLLRDATVPTIMVCPSCVTNPAEQKRLRDMDYNRKEALAILKGIVAYYAPPGTAASPAAQTPVATIPPTPQPPAPREAQSVAYAPLLLNPVNSNIDQTWIYGEKWGNLPIKYGVSFVAPRGTDVVASGNGAIIAADASGQTSDISPYRNYVIIRHDDAIDGKEVYTLYGQMETVTAVPGRRVHRGEKIGTTDAPYAEAQFRSREFEFEVRIGGDSRAYVRNPELFINHATQGTGMIVGRLARTNGELLSGKQISDAKKPSELTNYSYTMTYADGIPGTDRWQENFVIGDVVPGKYVLKSTYGEREVEVAPGRITYVNWVVQ
jgi:N-acetylmuramoyl-L-alanine amidase